MRSPVNGNRVLKKMKYKIVSPFDIADKKVSFRGLVDITDFEQCNKYREYKEAYLKGLSKLLSIYISKKAVREKILERYNKKSIFIQLRSEGSIIDFYWPNGELKAITLLENYLITDQEYWLSFYPFIDIVETKEERYAMINKKFARIARDELVNEETLSIISHNNHFGHFL